MLTLIAAIGATLMVIILLAKGIRTVPQANVAVVTKFGKFTRILGPGLHVINPLTAKIAMVVPVQNRTAQLQFAAITEDQAAVQFTSTIIYTVKDMSEETILQVAFKFIDERSFGIALTSAVEASVREFVASKKQAEVLGLRQSIVDHAKHNLDDQLASWGYQLVDLTVNDITFDPEVMKSMSRVVSAKNAQTAAEFEGQALLIQRTKAAEAEGRAQVIAAQNGAEAARLRGEGIAAQRAAIAKGLSESGQELAKAGMDVSVLTFSMWTETLRDVAMHGKGNTIFLDGGLDSMDQAMRRTQAMLTRPASSTGHVAAEHAESGNQTTTDVAAPDAPVHAGSLSDSARDLAEQLAADTTAMGIDTAQDAVTTDASAKAHDYLQAHPGAGRVADTIAEIANAVTGKVSPPSGWYDDPKVDGLERLWNGAAWTSQTRPKNP